MELVIIDNALIIQGYIRLEERDEHITPADQSELAMAMWGEQWLHCSLHK